MTSARVISLLWCVRLAHGAIHGAVHRHDRGRHQPDVGVRLRWHDEEAEEIAAESAESKRKGDPVACCFWFPYGLVVPALTWEHATFVFGRIDVGLVHPASLAFRWY